MQNCRRVLLPLHVLRLDHSSRGEGGDQYYSRSAAASGSPPCVAKPQCGDLCDSKLYAEAEMMAVDLQDATSTALKDQYSTRTAVNQLWLVIYMFMAHGLSGCSAAGRLDCVTAPHPCWRFRWVLRRRKNFLMRLAGASALRDASRELEKILGLWDQLCVRGGVLLASHVGRPGSHTGGVVHTFRMWESCRTIPVAGEFSRGSPTPSVLAFRRCSILTCFTLIGSQDLDVKSRTIPPLSTPRQDVRSNKLFAYLPRQCTLLGCVRFDFSAIKYVETTYGLRLLLLPPTAWQSQWNAVRVSTRMTRGWNGATSECNGGGGGERKIPEKIRKSASSFPHAKIRVRTHQEPNPGLFGVRRALYPPHYRGPINAVRISAPGSGVSANKYKHTLPAQFTTEPCGQSASRDSEDSVSCTVPSTKLLWKVTFAFFCEGNLLEMSPARLQQLERQVSVLVSMGGSIEQHFMFSFAACSRFSFFHGHCTRVHDIPAVSSHAKTPLAPTHWRLRSQTLRLTLGPVRGFKVHDEDRFHRLACSPPTKAYRVQSSAWQLRIFACGNRGGQYRWSAGFLGDLPFPLPFHSGAAPYIASPSSALKTSIQVREAKIVEAARATQTGVCKAISPLRARCSISVQADSPGRDFQRRIYDLFQNSLQAHPFFCALCNHYILCFHCGKSNHELLPGAPADGASTVVNNVARSTPSGLWFTNKVCITEDDQFFHWRAAAKYDPQIFSASHLPQNSLD
ncbi:hypothetical protein PR048_016064 [Dryococelus australis]|uniref:Uncharacterized protein n=1 Tax=Dryococelus australis TaxID=614101 RepID=A0ABQ9HIQ0_9NEOP|nr:hypothetical protein PR048_016064 [Dryococelus australis]